MTGRRLALVEITRIQELARAGVPTAVIAKRFERHVKTIRAILRLADTTSRTPRAVSAAYSRQQGAHGRRAHGAPRGAPPGITARPFTDDWWAENNANYVRAMRAAHPERALLQNGLTSTPFPDARVGHSPIHGTDDSRDARSEP
jgi:hypothetical protein